MANVKESHTWGALPDSWTLNLPAAIADQRNARTQAEIIRRREVIKSEGGGEFNTQSTRQSRDFLRRIKSRRNPV